MSSLDIRTQINQQKTVIEKMGGYPKFLLEGPGNLSDRDVHIKIIGDRMKDKYITYTSHQNAPLEPFIGIIDTKGSDWVENHDQYLGQALLDTHDNE